MPAETCLRAPVTSSNLKFGVLDLPQFPVDHQPSISLPLLMLRLVLPEVAFRSLLLVTEVQWLVTLVVMEGLDLVMSPLASPSRYNKSTFC
jgi:hypothetical protein